VEAQLKFKTDKFPWLLLVCGQLVSSSADEESVEARYLINGVERGLAGAQTPTGTQGPWIAADLIGASDTEQQLTFELRHQKGDEAALQNLQVVAVAIRDAAATRVAEAPALLKVPASVWTTLAVLQVQINVATKYFIMASSYARERPGNATVGVRMRINDDFWPVASGESLSHFSNARAYYSSFFVARAVDLAPGTHTFELEGYGSEDGLGSEVLHSRIIAFPAEALGNLSSHLTVDEAEISKNSAFNMLDVPSTGSSTYLWLQNAFVRNVVNAGARTVQFVSGSSMTTFEHIIGNRESQISYGALGVMTTADAPHMETRISARGGESLFAKESAIHLFKLPADYN